MDPYDEHIIDEAKKIVTALGRMFAPLCEVLLHDLRRPEASILAIENSITGRKVGDSATQLGLARITQPNFPDVVQNYISAAPDGRKMKSTSIGLRGRSGQFIASICLNLDATMVLNLASVLQGFANMGEIAAPPVQEELRTLSLDEIRVVVNQFAADEGAQVGQLNTRHRREVVAILQRKGLLDLKNAKTFTAKMLGVTRPSIYNYLAQSQT